MDCNAARPDKTAFIDDTGTLSHGALAERIRREERVLLLMHDCSDWPVSFLGAMYAGIVPVAVNTLIVDRDYRKVLSQSDRALVLQKGQVVLQGSADEVAGSSALAGYLGV